MSEQKHSQESCHQVPHTTCAVYAFDAPFKLDWLYCQYRVKQFVRTTLLYSWINFRVHNSGCTDVDGSWRTSPLSKTTSRFQENHHSLHHCCVSDMLGWVYAKGPITMQASLYWTIKTLCPDNPQWDVSCLFLTASTNKQYLAQQHIQSLAF